LERKHPEKTTTMKAYARKRQDIPSERAHSPSSERTPIFREDEVMKIHIRLFDTKWIQEDVLSNGLRLGSSDTRSVADLGNCCELVRKIKLAPSRKVTSSPFPFLA